ncbi:MAG TPA: hypothetical protein VIC71_05855 [Gammaproteobacteria bacterium]
MTHRKTDDAPAVIRAVAPILALLAGSAAAQSPITDLITDADLVEARASVAECLQAVPPLVADYAARRWSADVETLSVRFVPHDGNAHYTAELRRAPGEEWRLVRVGLAETLVEAANTPPVRQGGVFAPGVADAIAATVRSKWAHAFPEMELRLLTIESSLAPSSSCAGEEPPSSVSHRVQALARPTASDGIDPVPSEHVTFRLVPADRGALAVADAQWTMDSPALDGSMRQRLRALIDVTGQSDQERALAAALAAVPPQFASARLLRADFAVQGDGRLETFQVQLGEIELTPKRRVWSVVQCLKEVEGEPNWQCEHRLAMAAQTVSGQLEPVHFPLFKFEKQFSEEFVERLIVEVRAQLPRFLEPGEAQEGIEVVQLAPFEERIVARTNIGADVADVSIVSDGDGIRVVSLTRR